MEMKTQTRTSTIGILDFDVEVEYDYRIENDGIGAYEFWGARGYDKGTDYVIVEDIRPQFIIRTSKGLQVIYTPEERRAILEYIRDHRDKVIEDLLIIFEGYEN